MRPKARLPGMHRPIPFEVFWRQIIHFRHAMIAEDRTAHLIFVWSEWYAVDAMSLSCGGGESRFPTQFAKFQHKSSTCFTQHQFECFLTSDNS